MLSCCYATLVVKLVQNALFSFPAYCEWICILSSFPVAVFQEYQQISGRDIEDSIKREMSGCLEDIFLAIGPDFHFITYSFSLAHPDYTIIYYLKEHSNITLSFSMHLSAQMFYHCHVFMVHRWTHYRSGVTIFCYNLTTSVCHETRII